MNVLFLGYGRVGAAIGDAWAKAGLVAGQGDFQSLPGDQDDAQYANHGRRWLHGVVQP